MPRILSTRPSDFCFLPCFSASCTTLYGPRTLAKDWPQWCGSDAKNMVSAERGCPRLSPGQTGRRHDRPATAINVKWGVKLGDAFYSTPTVAGGKVFTSAAWTTTTGTFICFDAATGQAALAMEGPAARGAAHASTASPSASATIPQQIGVCSSAAVEGGPRLFRLQPLRGGVPRRGRLARPSPARPACSGRSTCGRSWACFPAIRRTARR